MSFLKQRQVDLQIEHDGLQLQITNANKRLHEIKNQLKDIQRQIQIENVQPNVSDHAVLRYIERTAGIDCEAIRNHILEMSLDSIKAGASKVTISGIKFVIHQKTVVTCYED